MGRVTFNCFSDGGKKAKCCPHHWISSARGKHENIGSMITVDLTNTLDFIADHCNNTHVSENWVTMLWFPSAYLVKHAAGEAAQCLRSELGSQHLCQVVLNSPGDLMPSSGLLKYQHTFMSSIYKNVTSIKCSITLYLTNMHILTTHTLFLRSAKYLKNPFNNGVHRLFRQSSHKPPTWSECIPWI